MSMKRTKKSGPATRAGASEGSLGFNPPSRDLPKWDEAVAPQPDTAFASYSPSENFAHNALMAHPKFGRGLVVAVDGGRIDVLFEEGVKKLVHGLT